MKILALDGSPRKKGNSSLLPEEFLCGANAPIYIWINRM